MSREEERGVKGKVKGGIVAVSMIAKCVKEKVCHRIRLNDVRRGLRRLRGGQLAQIMGWGGLGQLRGGKLAQIVGWRSLRRGGIVRVMVNKVKEGDVCYGKRLRDVRRSLG